MHVVAWHRRYQDSGPKQASLFLRNIGYSAYVAVLDIHVLTYMSWIGLTDAPLKSVSTIKKYESSETTFIEHSHSLGYAPDHFDIAVWVVVRVAKGGDGRCGNSHAGVRWNGLHTNEFNGPRGSE